MAVPRPAAIMKPAIDRVVCGLLAVVMRFSLACRSLWRLRSTGEMIAFTWALM
jgi:hypothetical protein